MYFFVKTHVPCIDTLHHIESQYLLSTQSIAELRGYIGQNSIFEIPLFFIFLHNNIKNLCLIFCSMLRLRIKFWSTDQLRECCGMLRNQNSQILTLEKPPTPQGNIWRTHSKLLTAMTVLALLKGRNVAKKLGTPCNISKTSLKI